mmetsp:Transcript_20869/g.35869  ORF Transcript_20869/g.35869 Transcript_20869/m.35869 type:complete len:145 (-) Transcript_20869:262-696(-)
MWNAQTKRVLALALAASCLLNATSAQRGVCTGADCGSCVDEERCSTAGCEWTTTTTTTRVVQKKEASFSKLRHRRRLALSGPLLPCNDTEDHCKENCGDQGCEWTAGSLPGGGSACVDGNGIACVSLMTVPVIEEKCMEKKELN